MSGDTNISWTREEILENNRKERIFKRKLKREILRSEDRRREKALYEARHRNGGFFSERKKKMTTSKILMYYILINCTVIEVYSMYTMYTLKDLSPLYSLIGAVIGESLSYAIYCAKSFKDTKEEVKSKLERDKFEASLKSLTEEPDLPPDEVPQDDDHSGDIPVGEKEIKETFDEYTL